MNQILRILKKDVRRHWPEILISFAVLALYTDRELQPWRNAFEVDVISRSPFFYILSERYFAPALIIFWIFLVIRVVQGESLVGDRQWWTTKPYIWWQLMLAKLLFIFVFVCGPLFLVQLFLLHHFQYPILSNVPALAMMQFSLFTLLVVFVVLLASLTKKSWPAPLGCRRHRTHRRCYGMDQSKQHNQRYGGHTPLHRLFSPGFRLGKRCGCVGMAVCSPPSLALSCGPSAISYVRHRRERPVHLEQRGRAALHSRRFLSSTGSNFCKPDRVIQ